MRPDEFTSGRHLPGGHPSGPHLEGPLPGGSPAQSREGEAADPPRGSVRSTRYDDPTGPPTESGEGTLLSLAEAAKAVNTTVQALWVRVQRGELSIHRVEHEGRTASTAVALGDILRLYMNHPDGPSAGPARPAPAGPAPSEGSSGPRASEWAGRSEGRAAERSVSGPSGGAREWRGESPAAGASAGGAAGREEEEYGYDPEAPAEIPTYDVPRSRPAPVQAHAGGAAPRRAPEAWGSDPRLADPRLADPRRSEATPSAETRAEVERLRETLLEERVHRARIEGKLATLQDMETSQRRYSERLEQRLEQAQRDLSESKREALSLARALGQAEGRVLQLQGRPDAEGAPDPDAPRPRRKRRWWRRKRR